jgi:ribosomal protein L7/L12
LLKSAPTTLKENLPAAQADLYKQAFAKTGASCDVENMKYNLSGLSLE